MLLSFHKQQRLERNLTKVDCDLRLRTAPTKFSVYKSKNFVDIRHDYTSDEILFIRIMLETSFIKVVILHQCHCLFFFTKQATCERTYRFVREIHIVNCLTTSASSSTLCSSIWSYSYTLLSQGSLCLSLTSFTFSY